MSDIVAISDINIRDPYVLKAEGKYYMYGTDGKYAWEGIPDGIYAYISEDMKGFRLKRVFRPESGFWADRHFWAPEVHLIDGRYYMFASFLGKDGVRRCQILVSDSPAGEFEPLGEPVTPANQNCLDATYVEWKGRRYCIYCHEWVDCKDGEMMLVELDDQLRPVGDPTLLFRASEAEWTYGGPEGNYITDGPFVVRLGSGKLLMLWSSSGYNGYAMGTSVAEDITGPWRHSKTPLIDCDGGHGMLFRDGEDMYLTYHRPNFPSTAERPYFVRVVESGDGLTIAEADAKDISL